MKKSLLVLAALLSIACSGKPETPPEVKGKGEIAKIRVANTGQISINGHDVTFAQLEPMIKHLRATDGTVWYYREGGGGRPPSEMMQVIKLVIDNGVRMSLSSKSDFSTYIDKKGEIHPRLP